MKLLYLIIFIIFIGCSPKEENIYSPQYTPSNTTSYNSKSKLKPYEVLGRWYYPRNVQVGDTFTGISSWYGPNFHGKLTANGEIYDMYGYTAANKILPLNTIIKVINLSNNKSVVVRVNDRGPFVKGRILDLSYAAGKKIGIDKTGTAMVKIIVLSTPNTPKKLISYKKPKKNGKIKIQIGAFTNLSGAKIFKQEYSNYYKNVTIQKINNKYKVFVTGFNSYESAKNYKIKHNIKGFIVK